MVVKVFENFLLFSKITPQTLDQYWSTLVALDLKNFKSSDSAQARFRKCSTPWAQKMRLVKALRGSSTCPTPSSRGWCVPVTPSIDQLIAAVGFITLESTFE